MSMQIKKSGTGIGKSGTGIHRSGTGIHRSGTGIKKGGTGMRMAGLFTSLALASSMFFGQTMAAEPDLLVSERNDSLLISLHTDDGIFTGAVPMASGDGGYFQVGLHRIAAASDGGMVFDPLVKGTGSGSAGEEAGGGLLVKGTGSGNSGESAGRGGGLLVKGTGSGNSGESAGSEGDLLVKGTGSGSSGEGLCDDAGLLVKGTGSGNSGESASDDAGLLVKGTGSGNSGESVGGDFGLLVKGTGSGNSGESDAGCGDRGFDLLAEVVIDAEGAHVLIHDRQGNEPMVGFVAAAQNNAPDDRRGATRGFVAAP